MKKQGRNMNNEEVNEEASALIERPKEYVVKFTFPKVRPSCGSEP